ncbi:MAG: hypothetical protein KDA37_18400, partial [Planctomycetales bacterium]|nr:hypothetical protein [Planctomycetales bacterium]
MRRTGIPHVVNSSGERISLHRVDLCDRRVLEDYLQSTLDASPELLPVEELDTSFTPLVSLGREIISIDNLFVTPGGRLVLVETKLWRNPEATREVVAQLLDYASRLSKFSYVELESEARRAMGDAPIGEGSLYELVASRFPEEVLQESRFIDEVQKCLRDARFLLLVVGDGIRENLEDLVDLLHRQPQMLYKLALVEMQIYENPEAFAGRMVLPQVVASTTEIVRAVVRVKTTGTAEVSVAIEEQPEKGGSPGRRTLSEEVFFDELPDECTRRLFRRLLVFAEEIGAVPGWRASSVSIQLPDPGGSKQMLTLFLMHTSGHVDIGWLPGQLERVAIEREIGVEFSERMAGMFSGITTHKSFEGGLSRRIT